MICRAQSRPATVDWHPSSEGRTDELVTLIGKVVERRRLLVEDAHLHVARREVDHTHLDQHTGRVEGVGDLDLATRSEWLAARRLLAHDLAGIEGPRPQRACLRRQFGSTA